MLSVLVLHSNPDKDVPVEEGQDNQYAAGLASDVPEVMLHVLHAANKSCKGSAL